MLITQYGISVRAVSKKQTPISCLACHGMGDIYLTRACCVVVGQPVDPQKIRGKFWGNVELSE